MPASRASERPVPGGFSATRRAVCMLTAPMRTGRAARSHGRDGGADRDALDGVIGRLLELLAEHVGIALLVGPAGAGERGCDRVVDDAAAVDDGSAGVEDEAASGREPSARLLDDAHREALAERPAAVAIGTLRGVDEVRRVCERIVLTDLNEGALLFARVNAHLA